ncbi:unnamed protein product [Lactuca virosa]|uniref:Uncharacterized protein n=1 Tax=Lactuca virosa TaxID=75947 RepID=A0AAU9LRH1_9ASTR|nr:unnamed protein product [Lactuca virosa]
MYNRLKKNINEINICKDIIALFFVLGFLSIFKLITTLIKWVFIIFFQPPKNLKNNGSWAIITGEIGGIGKAFAFQLAQKGLHLILVSRNLSKLKYVFDEIVSVHPNTKIKIFTMDFSGKNMVVGVREMQKVIYVGLTYLAARFFHEVEEEVWMNVMKVNVIDTSLD